MKQLKTIFLLAQSAACTYLGYVTLHVYLSNNNGRIGFRFLEAEDWMLYSILIICFGFAAHALYRILPERKSA